MMRAYVLAERVYNSPGNTWGEDLHAAETHGVHLSLTEAVGHARKLAKVRCDDHELVVYSDDYLTQRGHGRCVFSTSVGDVAHRDDASCGSIVFYVTEFEIDAHPLQLLGECIDDE